jgi:hypothetical protein
VQWSVTGRAATDAVWSASGFHVAYRSGAALRVVAANGTGDRRLARPVAPVEPAWRPGEAELVAYADPQGRVVVTDPETGEPEWRTGAGAPVVALAWAARGDRLAVLGESRIRLFDVPATLRVTLALPDDTEGAGLAARPGGRDFAYAAFSPRSGRTSVYLLDGRTGASRLLFAGAGRFRELVWSPDGRHLLLGWAAADEWLFVPASREGQVEVVASAGQVLGGGTGFPEPLGWCCTEG